MSKTKKQQPTQQADPQVIYRKNRSRLIEQNRQLYSEILRLEAKVSAVLTKNISSQFKEKVQDQKFSSKHKELTQNQISQIKKLKKKILLIKNTDKPQQKQDVRQALDELIFVKKQKQKYVIQKQALIKKRRLKDDGLQLNKPLQQERKNMLNLYKTAQRQNFDLRNKVVKVQREINNLHKVKELAKTMAPKPSDEYDFEVKKVQHQIKRIQQEIGAIQKQWQPRIDSLTTEYFLLKEIKEEKEAQIKEMEKTLKTCQNRVLAMKQEAKILQDRARVSQIVISAQKREWINQIYETEKERNEFFQQFKNGPKNEVIKLPEPKQQVTKKSRSRSPNKRSSKKLFQTEPVKLFESQMKADNYKQREPVIIDPQQFEFNEFSQPKENIQQIQTKKAGKHFASVAVGTTFYYNQQQENNY